MIVVSLCFRGIFTSLYAFENINKYHKSNAFVCNYEISGTSTQKNREEQRAAEIFWRLQSQRLCRERVNIPPPTAPFNYEPGVRATCLDEIVCVLTTCKVSIYQWRTERAR